MLIHLICNAYFPTRLAWGLKRKNQSSLAQAQKPIELSRFLLCQAASCFWRVNVGAMNALDLGTGLRIIQFWWLKRLCLPQRNCGLLPLVEYRVASTPSKQSHLGHRRSQWLRSSRLWSHSVSGRTTVAESERHHVILLHGWLRALRERLRALKERLRALREHLHSSKDQLSARLFCLWNRLHTKQVWKTQ